MQSNALARAATLARMLADATRDSDIGEGSAIDTADVHVVSDEIARLLGEALDA
jgi:hypothetical protein